MNQHFPLSHSLQSSSTTASTTPSLPASTATPSHSGSSRSSSIGDSARTGSRSNPSTTGLASSSPRRNAALSSSPSVVASLAASTPFVPSGAHKTAMAAPAYLQHAAPPFGSGPRSMPSAPAQSPYFTTMNPFESAAANPIGTPYVSSPQKPSVLISGLPIDYKEDQVRLMLLFCKEEVDIMMLSPEDSVETGNLSAVVEFASQESAYSAKDMLHGKPINSKKGEIAVEILPGSPRAQRGYPSGTAAPGPPEPREPKSTSPSRSSRYQNGDYHQMENFSPPPLRTQDEMPINKSEKFYNQNLFSPQSPIGNHLTDRARISGKTLINHDGGADDDTNDLLKDPVAYAEDRQQRRATAPTIPISRLASLSLNTTSGGPAVSKYNGPTMTPISAHPNAMSPTMSVNHVNNFATGNSHLQRQNYPMGGGAGQNFPPVNPADQNPPCNTLYVGNLPVDTAEEELKALFSKQRGYKRLCFRTKQNGPMCFVEFEDTSFATKTLKELYGAMLHNSIKGGIRLSFSKNPLGVRSGQTPNQNGASTNGAINGLMAGPSNGFASAHGPPPGLAAPPGLSSANRVPYTNSGTTTPYPSSGYQAPPYANGNGHGLSYSNNNGNNTLWAAIRYQEPTSATTPTGGVPGQQFPNFMMNR